MKTLLSFSLPLLLVCNAIAHEGHSHAPSTEMQKKIERLNTDPATRLVLMQNTQPELPDVASLFQPFAGKVNVRSDNQYLYVESNGMPDHPMMIGITAWQQQVPLPQAYVGSNAWRIPLHPIPAKHPMSAKSHFFRGAIALAANGVPIFNPIKNDGKTDTLIAGELDQWGGHCGRADDYHYHIAPVHLEKIVGQGNPVAVALDGYLIYGYNDPNGKPPTDLDWLNGHTDSNGDYHYHATKTYPYLNGGFHGEVVERGGQVDPQPRAQGVRPALPPLRGAKITGFENPTPGSYVVRFDVSGEKRSVQYTVADNGSATFQFVSPQGTKTERYPPRQTGREGRRNAQPPGDRKSNFPNQNQPRGSEGGEIVPPPGAVDPIVQTLDANRDGHIDKRELRNAAAALVTLDANKDGKISADELRGRREPGPQDADPGVGQSGGPRGPQEGEGPRQPWILVHADEIDLNKDKTIGRDEIVDEAARAFAGYDANQDNALSEAELNARGGSRSAMGGFLKVHHREIDRDGDGILTHQEAIGNAKRMFDRMDANGDGKITTEEMESSRR